jgi:hypothetical protein
MPHNRARSRRAIPLRPLPSRAKVHLRIGNGSVTPIRPFPAMFRVRHPYNRLNKNDFSSALCPPKAEVTGSNPLGRATVDESGHFCFAVTL